MVLRQLGVGVHIWTYLILLFNWHITDWEFFLIKGSKLEAISDGMQSICGPKGVVRSNMRFHAICFCVLCSTLGMRI